MKDEEPTMPGGLSAPRTPRPGVALGSGPDTPREPASAAAVSDMLGTHVAPYGRRFAHGEVLFREGEPAREAFLLHEGRVRLLKRVRLAERSLTVLRAGDLFGEGALLERVNRSSTAVALSDGVAVVLDGRGFRAIVEQFPLVAEQLVTQLVRRLREAEDQIEVLMVRDTQSKIITALLKMTRATTGPEELHLSPVELSSRVGLDVDTVKRAVQRLRDQQYLRIAGDRVEILDVDALRQLYALLGSKEELRGAG